MHRKLPLLERDGGRAARPVPRSGGWAGRFLGLALGLICLWGPAACGPAGEGAAASAGPRLLIGVGRDFYEGPASRTFLHGSTHTWEALTYLDQNLRPAPWLATSWHTPDGGLTWVFRLRAGVRFHDGSPLTAGDAAVSLRRIAATPRHDPTGAYRDLVGVEARGEDELVCRLAKPTPHFPSLVAYYGSPILKPATMAEGGRLTGLVATGPYRVAAIRPGYEVRLLAWEGYWGPRPAFKEVVFRYLGDAQTRALALMAGDLDAIADVGGILPEQAPELGAAAGVRLGSREVATTHYLVFNCRRPPFADPAARRWLAGVVAGAGLVERLAGGIAIPARDPYSRLARDYAFGLLRPPEGAPGPPPAGAQPWVILLHGGTIQRWPYLDLAQALEQELKARGVAARIAVSEAGAYHQALKRGDFTLSLQPNTLMTGDPEFFYGYYLAGEAPANPGWRDSVADRLLARAREAADPGKRRELYRELAELVARELPILPLFHERALYAYRARVAEFGMDHFFRPDLLAARPEARP